jgi:hypothetical protein
MRRGVARVGAAACFARFIRTVCVTKTHGTAALAPRCPSTTWREGGREVANEKGMERGREGEREEKREGGRKRGRESDFPKP